MKRGIPGALVVAVVLLLAGCGGEESEPTRASDLVDLSLLKGRIAFSAGVDDIHVVNADGTGLRRLTTSEGWDFDPSWSPDGSQIVFRRQPEDDSTAEIVVMNADGTGQKSLTENGVPEWGPAWSPDGEWIAFNGVDESTGRMRLVVARPDGSEARRVGGIYAEYPDWSPDGKRIAFMSQTSDATENYEIYVINADGSGLERLTHTPGSDGWPAWSPDGERIAFTSVRDDCAFNTRSNCESTGNPQEFHAIYVMNADGSGQRRLTEGFGQFAVWSPDGDYILYSPHLNVIRPDGSGLRRLPLNGLPAEPEMPDWAP